MVIFHKKNNSIDYVIKPFTLDYKKTKIFDDGYSITSDTNGVLTLNIHIPLASFEYLKKGYDLDKSGIKFSSNCNEQYMRRRVITKYSLCPGEKKVLTLKVKNDGKYNFYYAICEDIEIINNYYYEYHNIDSKFNEILRYIFSCPKTFNDNHVVSRLMTCYSHIFSRYLYLNSIGYNIIDKTYEGEDYRKGCFTNPLRQNKSLINQFIFLKYILEELNINFLDDFSEMLLFTMISKDYPTFDNIKQLVITR
jgi:hypothetical protein